MRKTKMMIAGGVVGVLVLGAVSVAAANVGGDDDSPITGEALEKASAAALAFTGEGTVTETEEGDEESYYQVEVTLDNGDHMDVQLDKQFNVVGSKREAGGESDDDGGESDGG